MAERRFRAILLDLGNTLAAYYTRDEFPCLLQKATDLVASYLAERALCRVSAAEIQQGIADENHEAPDYRVRPMEERLARVFRLAPREVAEHGLGMCRAFMQPIFARSRVYDDVPPTLRALRAAGYRLAIVSNAAWGSPPVLWREELRRLRLDVLVDEFITCRDVGWRKPAPQIFEFTLQRLGMAREQCLFIGDDRRWDVTGPRSVGIEAWQIVRQGERPQDERQVLGSLTELLARL